MGAARHDVSPVAALKVADPSRWNETVPLPGESNTNKTVISRLWVRDNYFHIPYAGPPGHFKTVPYIEILRGDIPVDALKDKIVLVGATAAALTDAYPTPVSGGERAMAGIEVQANIIQALRENIDIRLVSASKLIFFACLITLSLMLAYLWLTPRLSLLLTVVAIFLCLIGAALLFRYQYIWMSPTVPIMTLLLAYPLWSWRKLEATQRYFDTELTRLESERSIVPQETAQSIAPQAAAKLFMPDVVEKRIAAVQSAAQRMRNLNRFVADSLESLPQAALVTNADGRVMIANSSADALFKSRRQRTGDRPADPTLEGRDVFALMAAFQHEDGRSWREIWVDAYEETHLVSLEAKGPEGHEFLVQIAPSFSARGKQTGSILTLVDISPLRESERRRDEALRFLSHDMRSPQASILTLLDMYSHDPQSMTTEKLVERVGKYSRRTLNLADDFLRLAKAERVKSQDFELLELGELLRDAVEEAWSVATTKKIAIKLDIPANEAWVAGDRDLLTRALLNLLSNATKYSPPETTITCALHGEAGKWILDITDQGYGIGESDMSRLFMRFTRLKHEGKPDEGGIGLGLVFVKTVIERHGGAINVRSRVATPENSASGTTFSLTFPAKEAPLD
jgi:signal transduction histidine kinase